MDMSVVLPEECIRKIISFTCARDACRFSAVSPVFKSAADSDAVWEMFLPSDYQEIVSSSASPSLLTTNLSKKDIYLHLCHNPIIINNGTMSFTIEKESGKKCFMVGARGLSIEQGDNPIHWRWPSLPESRFAVVAKVNWLFSVEVEAEIDTKILSPKTTYAAYFVFKLECGKGFVRRRSVEVGVYLEGLDTGETRNVLLHRTLYTPTQYDRWMEIDIGLDTRERRNVLPDPALYTTFQSVSREDGWMEIEMGEFFNENGDGGTLICNVSDSGPTISGQRLIVEGIELRPKM